MTEKTLSEQVQKELEEAKVFFSSLLQGEDNPRAKKLWEISKEDVLPGVVITPDGKEHSAAFYAMAVYSFACNYSDVFFPEWSKPERNESLIVVAFLLAQNSIRSLMSWGSEVLFRAKAAGIFLTREEVAAFLAIEGNFQSNRSKNSLMAYSALSVLAYCADCSARELLLAEPSIYPHPEKEANLPDRSGMSNQGIYETVLKTVVEPVYGEQQTRRFGGYLLTRGFYLDPASTKYHLSEEGGLCLHSLNVLYNLFRLYPPTNEQEAADRALVALGHDLCKNGAYEKTYRGYVWADRTPFGHGRKSLYLLTSFFPNISLDMAKAIDGHMRDGENVDKLLFGNPLGVYLHLADMLASYIDEANA